MKFKLLLTMLLGCFALSAMSDCSVVISDEYGYSIADEGDDKILKDISEALLKKGYVVVDDSGKYKLIVNFLEMHNEGSSGPSSYGVQVYMKDASGLTLAESTKEASIVRMLVAGGSIPGAMTKKAIKAVVKQLPACN